MIEKTIARLTFDLAMSPDLVDDSASLLVDKLLDGYLGIIELLAGSHPTLNLRAVPLDVAEDLAWSYDLRMPRDKAIDERHIGLLQDIHHAMQLYHGNQDKMTEALAGVHQAFRRKGEDGCRPHEIHKFVESYCRHVRSYEPRYLVVSNLIIFHLIEKVQSDMFHAPLDVVPLTKTPKEKADVSNAHRDLPPLVPSPVEGNKVEIARGFGNRQDTPANGRDALSGLGEGGEHSAPLPPPGREILGELTIMGFHGRKSTFKTPAGKMKALLDAPSYEEFKNNLTYYQERLVKLRVVSLVGEPLMVSIVIQRGRRKGWRRRDG